VDLEASRLHALIDGLALHAVMRPASLPPSRVVAMIARHLNTLTPGPDGRLGGAAHGE
jgi:hypothetical protein